MPILTPFRPRLPKPINPRNLPAVVCRPAVPRPAINERVHRTAAHQSLPQEPVRPSPARLANHHPSDRHPVPGICAEVRLVLVISGAAAAHHGSFRPGPPGADSLCFLWHVAMVAGVAVV